MTHTSRCARSIVAGLAAVLFLASSLFAQQPGQSIEDFKDSLDARVFQTGGYGAWDVPLGPIFDTAASQYNVPRELLLSLAYLGSAFENRGDQPTLEYGYGVTALRENTWSGRSLALAAELLGTPADSLKIDPALNINGAAAVLNAWADEFKIERKTGLDAWLPVVVKYAGLADAETDNIFAAQVYTHLKNGLSVTNSYGESFSFPAQKISVDPASLMPKTVILSTDYGPATWNPAASCNYSSSTHGNDAIIIHTVEGSYAGCISWFKNCDANTSAHYVVAYDGRITQMVRENQTAWHAGCYNSRSIGIEHEGYASSSSHPTAQYNASGDLCRDICDDWGIPKAKRTVAPGIMGHIDVTRCCCGTHTDPGNGWDWTYFINRVTGTTPTPAWAATYVNQSYPSTMTAGSTVIAWAEFRNDGTGHWKHAETRIGTSSPQDRSSPFCTPSNWVGCNRPSDVDQSDVAQGQVGRFTFILTAPSTPGTYTEKYKLVREGVTWFGPEITWTINVTASQGNLNGTITNAATGAAVSGASVTLTGVGSTTSNSSGAYSFSNVTAGTYTVSVGATGFNSASDSVAITAGATATKNFSLTPSDTQAPSTPTLQTATATGPTSVQLTWTASTDNIGVTGYQVRRNGTVIGTSTSTSYTDNTASPLGTYTYDVRARDSVPNYSAWSNSLQVTTPPNPPEPTIVFSDGFNGNTNNWTQQVQNYDYSTTVNHGTYAGGGAAYCGAGQADQMFHTFSRPFAQGKAWGYFYDGKGGWKTGSCGNSYRQAFSIRNGDGTAKMYIDNEFYNSPDNSKYYYRIIGTGGIGHTAWATRDAATDCNGTWVYFETTVNAGAPGALGTMQLKVTDRSGTFTLAPAMPSDFYEYGIGRVTLGLGVASTNECYWDDIAFQATPPGVPVMNAPTVVSTSEIKWNFSRADNNIFGFDLADANGTMVAPQYPAAGWITRVASSWTEPGLTPNTEYSRKVRAWNGTLNSAAFSNTVSAWTLSPAPTTASLEPDNAVVCANSPVTWTAVGGFGPGKVQYYKYVWDANPTHAFDGSEAIWSSGTIVTSGNAPGTWYLHVQGFNAEDVVNGTLDYAIIVAPVTDITAAPANAAACAGGTASFSLTAIGGELQYQWQKDEANLADGGSYAGVSTATLTINGVGPEHLGIYKCIVTGTCGTATSIEVDLTIKDATTITTQPLSQKVCTGTPASFSVVADGSALSYQWQKDEVNIEGAVEPIFEIAAVTTAEVGSYRCIVTGECGSVASDPAALSLAVPVAADFDTDCDVDLVDYDHFVTCALGPSISQTDPGCSNALLDGDDDVDAADFAIFQRCWSGGGAMPDEHCAD